MEKIRRNQYRYTRILSLKKTKKKSQILEKILGFWVPICLYCMGIQSREKELETKGLWFPIFRFESYSKTLENDFKIFFIWSNLMIQIQKSRKFLKLQNKYQKYDILWKNIQSL